jgi:hypothetical protein
MVGRKNRWERISELEKATTKLLSRLDRRPSIRHDLYPEEMGVHIWTYRGTNCTIIRNRQWEKMVADLKGDESYEAGILDVKKPDSLQKALARSIELFSAKIGNLQGYARFPRRPLYERGYKGIATYIPAPGGITFAEQYADGSFVYGYDTAHIDQEGVKFKDVSWHVVQVEFMVDAIMIARRLERAYRDAKQNSKRAKVLDEFDRRLRLRGKQIDVTGNFGVMLNLLSGQL